MRDQAVKDKIMAAAWGQSHLGEASVDVVVCGKLTAYDDAEEIYSSAPPEVGQKMVPMIGGLYSTNDGLQRDEAIRSASLAAMTLMLLAQDMGYATCPMIGFDHDAVAKLVNLPADHAIGPMVAIGKKTKDSWPKPGQLPLSELVIENQWSL